MSAQSGAGAGDARPPASALIDSPTMLLVFAGRTAETRLAEALSDLRVSLRHVGALGHLTRSPGLSYSELARRARVTVQSMHATVGQLIAMGAVRGPATGGRGRAAPLVVTEAGRALMVAVSEVVAGLDDELADSLAGDVTALTRALRLLLAANRPPLTDADG